MLEDISKRIIFVSFEQGGGGHRFARTLAALPNIYWYSSKANGVNPWNLYFKTTSIRQRRISAAHFDRMVPKGRLPPTQDYVQDFFPEQRNYYDNVFVPEWNRVVPDTDKKFIYCTHSTPECLQSYFPHSKIFNIQPPDVEALVDRYMLTTARFPGYIRLKNIVPEDNEHLKMLNQMKRWKPDFNIADIWAWTQHDKYYTEDLAEDYRSSITKKFELKLFARSSFKGADNIMNISGKHDWKAIKAFLST